MFALLHAVERLLQCKCVTESMRSHRANAIGHSKQMLLHNVGVRKIKEEVVLKKIKESVHKVLGDRDIFLME